MGMAFQPTMIRMAGTVFSNQAVTGTLVETTAQQRDYMPGEFNVSEVWRLTWGFRGSAVAATATCRIRVGSLAGTVLSTMQVTAGNKFCRGLTHFNFQTNGFVSHPFGDNPTAWGPGTATVSNIAYSANATFSLFLTVQLGNVADSLSLIWYDAIKSPL